MAWAVDVTTEEELKTAVTSSNTDIKLTANIELSGTLEINRATQLTIDLNGHNITADGFRAIHIKQGKVTITSDSPAMISAEGSVPAEHSVIRLGDGAVAIQGTKNTVDFTLGENVTVSTTVETCYGITVFGGSTTETLTVNGKVKTTGRSAIAGNGNAWNDGTTIIIGEKADISTTNDVAIYQPQNGTLTVSGKVTGAGGIEIKAGKLEVTDKAKITATGAISHVVNNDGTSTRGYAIAIVENEHYTAGVSEVKISKDATIDGPVAVLKDSENTNTQNVKFTGDMKMLVKVTTTEAGETKSFGQYLTLELAMNQAPADATIKLLDNVEIASTIETTKNYTLDLDGKTVTSDGQRALWIKSGTVNINSTTAGGKMVVPTLSNHDGSVIRVGSDDSADASLTLDEGVTISADECYGITIFGKNTTESLTVNGTVNTKIRPAISGNGTAGLASTTITIGENAKITTTNEVAIYQPQAGTLTVNGTVEGEGGIEIKGGSLVVGSSAKIKATGTPKHEPNGDGTSTRGYSVAIVETSSGYGNNEGVSAVTIDNAATLVGPVGQLQDSPKSDGFNPTYSGNAVTKKVAAIGNDEYFTLHDAITIVPSQGTVKLIDNLTESKTLVMDVVKTYTIDLNGKTLTGDGCAALQITSGHVTLDGATGSKVTVSGTASQAAIVMGDDTGDNRNVSLTINENVTVDGSTLSRGILLSGSKTRETLTVNGTVSADGHCAISGSKDADKGGTNITIAPSGKVQANNAVAIYHPQSGDLVVKGTVEGTGTTAGAIEMKGGDLTVASTAMITATGNPTHTANTEAPSTNGYAIALVENAAFTGVGRVNIDKDATMTGVIACIIDSKNNTVAEPMFTGDITLVAETNISEGRGDKYVRLTDAIDAASGGEVKLLDDLAVTSAVTISKAVTLNMDDYSIINNRTSDAAIIVNANVTLKNGGIVSAETGDPATYVANGGIQINGGTVTLRQMNVKTGGVSLAVAGGTVTVDQASSFSATLDNTLALSDGSLTLAGKVYNTSSEKHAVAATGSASLAAQSTVVISSAHCNGIDWQSTGALTIAGGKVMGVEAVKASNGTVTINGGTFTGTGHAFEVTGTACTPSVKGGTFVCGSDDTYKPIVSTSTGFVEGTETYFSKAIAQSLCQSGYMVSKNPKNNGMYYLVDEIVITDGTDWDQPTESFHIKKAKYIRSNGMGANGTKFGTLCLPFSYSATQTNMTFYTVNRVESNTLYLDAVTTSYIAAGTPVIFKFATETTNFTIESTDATISNESAGSANNLVGTFTKQEIKSGLSEIYYLNSDAFHQAKQSLTVPAYRAYIKFGSADPARADVLDIFIEDEPEDIDSIFQEDAEEMIFDLQGNRLEELKPGFNLLKKNGRTIKVYVNK